jgi:hypothetical protein
MQHKFAVGEVVELVSAPGLSNRPAGPCRIVMRLPFEGRRLQYRIQSMREATQRVVEEDDLRRSDAKVEAPRPNAPEESLFSSIPITRR